MPKSKKSGTETRKCSIAYPVRFTPEQFELVREKAGDCKLSIAEFIRRCSTGRQTRSKIDSKIINELRRLGGLQKHLYYESGATSEEYTTVLAQIVDAISRIMSADKAV